MAVAYRPATPVRDPAALVLFSAAADPTRWREPTTAASRSAGSPSTPGPLAGLVAAALAVAVIAAPVAVASTAGTSHRECAPVPYVLDGQLGPPTAAQLVEDVFAEIEVMSGIRFTAAPEGQRARAPVRLAWVPPSADIAWDELQLGWATAHWDRRGRFETVVSGEVLFRHPNEVEQILRGPVDWHTIARHEIGHLLVLPHQSDPGDVMHPRLTGAAQAWSASDRAHLAARGRAAGCR